MRVAVPLEQCWHDVPGGTARAAIDLVAALDRRDDVEIIGVAARHKGPPTVGYDPSVEVRHLPIPRRLLYETWHSFRWPHVEFSTGPIDVLHTLGGAIAASAQAPLVATVHDLAFVHHPDKFTRNGLRFFHRGLDLIVRHAAAILCSSEATLEDCAWLGIDRSRLRHVPLAVEVGQPSDDDIAAVRASLGLDGDYVVCVGTLEPRKNVAGLLRAWALLDRADITLVIVGPSGWGAGAAPPEGSSVVTTGFVEQSVRDALYAGAVASCYPSLFEGFGMPVLESLALGCPVVTSTGTATEEIVRDGGGIAVDPHDHQAIADALASIIDDPDRRATLAAQGRAVAEGYSWERTAAAVVDAYRSVC